MARGARGQWPLRPDATVRTVAPASVSDTVTISNASGLSSTASTLIAVEGTRGWSLSTGRYVRVARVSCGNVT